MKAELAQFIVDTLNELDGERYSIFENYSGRGMFGRTTTAIVIPEINTFVSDILFCAKELGRMDEDCLLDNFSQIRFDNLGMEYIVY